MFLKNLSKYVLKIRKHSKYIISTLLHRNYQTFKYLFEEKKSYLNTKNARNLADHAFEER